MFKRRKTADIDLLNAGFRYAYSLSGNQQDAEDLVHDAWIRLDRRYGRVSEKPLLFRTIRNLYIDQYRRRQVIHFVDDYDTEHDATYSDAQSHESAIELRYLDAEALQLSLNRLRDVEREYLFLAVVEGYTADEIGQMTGTARGTVLSILHRSKRKLRRLLTEESDGDDSQPRDGGRATVEAADNGSVNSDDNVVELLPGRAG